MAGETQATPPLDQTVEKCGTARNTSEVSDHPKSRCNCAPPEVRMTRTRPLLDIEEVDQAGIEFLGVADIATVGGTTQHDQVAVRNSGVSQRSGTLERNNDVTVTMDDQGGNRDVREVLAKVLTGERRHAFERGILVGLLAETDCFLALCLCDLEFAIDGEKIEGELIEERVAVPS
jgi:hypothetical protein